MDENINDILKETFTPWEDALDEMVKWINGALQHIVDGEIGTSFMVEDVQEYFKAMKENNASCPSE